MRSAAAVTPSNFVPLATCPPLLDASDVVFTAAFTLEALLKVLAFGFRPYVSFFQNQVDLLIVVSSIIMLVLDTVSGLSIVKVGHGADWDQGQSLFLAGCVQGSPKPLHNSQVDGVSVA